MSGANFLECMRNLGHGRRSVPTFIFDDIVDMVRLEWIEMPDSVNIIDGDREMQIRLEDCINFTIHFKNRAGKIIHNRIIRAKIVRFEGVKNIRIVVHKLGSVDNENIENTGEEIEIDPESYRSITHDGCAFRRSGGSKSRTTRRRRRLRRRHLA